MINDHIKSCDHLMNREIISGSPHGLEIATFSVIIFAMYRTIRRFTVIVLALAVFQLTSLFAQYTLPPTRLNLIV